METTIEPEVITELRKRVAKANALAAEYNVADNINHSPAAFMSAVLREYDNVVNLYTSHSYLHRVVNDIATALGYRMGDTFEPEALVKEVKHLVAYAELAKENRTAMAALADVEAAEKEVRDAKL